MNPTADATGAVAASGQRVYRDARSRGHGMFAAMILATAEAKAADHARQAKVIEQAVDEWYSGAWAYGARVSAADRQRLVWTLTRRLGLQEPEPAASEAQS